MIVVPTSELVSAAGLLVGTAMKLRSGERLVVVCDAESSDIAGAIAQAAATAGAEPALTRLDQLRSVATNHTGERPHKVLPDVVRRAMLAAQASAFVASAPHGETSMREQLVHIVGACGVRHAHMPGVSAFGFARAHRIDYDVLARTGRDVEGRLELVRQLEIDSAAGTSLVAILDAQRRWVAHLGETCPGKSVMYPAGVLFAQPERIDGELVVDASLGEFFGAREGVLVERPVRFTIQASRVTNVDAPTPALREDITRMLSVAPHSDRVSLVALGVNTGVGAPTGDASVDITRVGAHFVIGDALGRVPAAGFSARTSFAACQASCRVRADGVVVIDQGRLSDLR